MKIQNGIAPTKLDHRDYDFHRTFGSVETEVLPDEYNCDAGLTMRDQDAEGLPFGCSGYAQSELGQDEDGIKYKPSFTYDKTRIMEGTYPQTVGCDIRDSLKSTIDYGLQGEMETTDQQAFVHHRGAYYNVQPLNGSWWDGIRSALWQNRLEKRSVSTGTPWYPEWEPEGNGNGILTLSGIVSLPSDIPNKSGNASWHNWKICGWKVINGVTYLIAKSWQGSRYGDNGWCYVSKEIIEQVLNVKGSAAFTLALAKDVSIQTVELSVFALIASYFRMLFNLK